LVLNAIVAVKPPEGAQCGAAAVQIDHHETIVSRVVDDVE